MDILAAIVAANLIAIVTAIRIRMHRPHAQRPQVPFEQTGKSAIGFRKRCALRERLFFKSLQRQSLGSCCAQGREFRFV